jgi:hypothetical protein
MFAAHITQARIAANIIYVEASARPHLHSGPTRVHLPAPSTTILPAIVKPSAGVPNMVVHCPPLYGHHVTDPILPLHLGDYVDFDLRKGEIFILRIRRNGGGAPLRPKRSITVEPPAPAGAKPKKRAVAVAAPDPAFDSDAGFSLHRLPSLPPYLADNADRIQGLSPQVFPNWDGSYGSIKHPVMDRLRKQFPLRQISRKALIDLYTCWHDPVLCLVATMVWGGIDAKRDNEEKNKVSHLRALLATSEADLLSVMNRLRALIRAGAFEKAFSACQKGTLKLSGVGPSFFTKLFFFIGQVPPVPTLAPLILDKWTAHAFCILGAQVCPSPRWSQMFDLKPLYKSKSDAVVLRTGAAAKIYRPYVAWVSHWAQQLDLPAAKLEQFLFGMSRKSSAGKSSENPRNQLIQLGTELFATP